MHIFWYPGKMLNTLQLTASIFYAYGIVLLLLKQISKTVVQMNIITNKKIKNILLLLCEPFYTRHLPKNKYCLCNPTSFGQSGQGLELLSFVWRPPLSVYTLLVASIAML